MDYDTTVAALQTMCEVPLDQEDENFRRILPRAFEYAEGRIYRELDFLATTTSQTVALTASNRNLALPASVIILRAVNVITPVATAADAGTRNPLTLLSIEALDFFWPNAVLAPTVPRNYALIGTSTQGYTVRVYPTPDQAYNAELIGVIRPAPLSNANTTTFLSTIYPDLFQVACMVFLAGYQRDFSSMAEDPAKAVSWEGQYKALRDGVMLEAARQKGEGAGWTSRQPPPAANLPRDRAPEGAAR